MTDTPDFRIDPAIGPTGAGYFADTARRLPRGVPAAPTPREWFELADVVAQAMHQQSHALHSIARDLAHVRAKLDELAPVAGGLARGGAFGAWSAARQQRKEGRNHDHPSPPESGPGAGT